MKRLYRVKLNPESLKKGTFTEGDNIVNAYLAFCGRICNYTSRQQAWKKAALFDGVVEPYKNDIYDNLTDISMVQLDEKILLHDIVKLLQGREAFNDADVNGETIYYGNVFADLLEEIRTGVIPAISAKTMGQLRDLAEFVTADYFQIVKP